MRIGYKRITVVDLCLISRSIVRKLLWDFNSVAFIEVGALSYLHIIIAIYFKVI